MLAADSDISIWVSEIFAESNDGLEVAVPSGLRDLKSKILKSGVEKELPKLNVVKGAAVTD